MLSATLVLLGLALIAIALAERPVRRLPMTPALIYIALGAAAGAFLGGPDPASLATYGNVVNIGIEFALLASLFGIGLRLGLPPTLRAWRAALLLAGPGMLVTVALACAVAHLLLGLPWPAALLLAAILAPTDPVLASDVQIRSESDRDAVRLALTAEGGLNDGTALPVVALALGLIGLQPLGSYASSWVWAELVWPLGIGALLGWAIGWLLGRALRARAAAGDRLARDELIYVGAVALAFGIAHALAASTFIVAFVAGATLLLPLRVPPHADAGQALADRLHDFGGRFERLAEGAIVLTVGALLSQIEIRALEVAFALLLVFAVRPLAVLLVLRRRSMPRSQRRLVAWFGIRGMASLYYLLLALTFGVEGLFADELVRITLLCIALSIVVHGISATPLMKARQPSPLPPQTAEGPQPPAPPLPPPNAAQDALGMRPLE